MGPQSLTLGQERHGWVGIYMCAYFRLHIPSVGMWRYIQRICHIQIIGLKQAAVRLADVWQTFGRCLADVWQMFSRCLADVWQTFGRRTADV